MIPGVTHGWADFGSTIALESCRQVASGGRGWKHKTSSRNLKSAWNLGDFSHLQPSSVP